MSYNINRFSDVGHSCDGSQHLFIFGRFSKYYQCTPLHPNPPAPLKCNSCTNFNRNVFNHFTLKKVNKENHLPSSLQNEFKKVEKGYVLDSNNCKPWHNASDRIVPSKLVFNNVPSRGNSTKTTITRLRPGATQSSGSGVDIKHNHYERYLLKKKGNILNKRCINP